MDNKTKLFNENCAQSLQEFAQSEIIKELRAELDALKAELSDQNSKLSALVPEEHKDTENPLKAVRYYISEIELVDRELKNQYDLDRTGIHFLNERIAELKVDLCAAHKRIEAERNGFESVLAELEAARKQEPDSWRVTAKRFCGTHTIDKEIAEHWMKTGEAYPLYASPVPAKQPEHIADEIEDLNACLDELRAIRDGQASPIRNTLNRACDRLDVAISKLHEVSKQLKGGENEANGVREPAQQSAADELIEQLWQDSNHGTSREDIEAAFNAGAGTSREDCLANSSLIEAALKAGAAAALQQSGLRLINIGAPEQQPADGTDINVGTLTDTVLNGDIFTHDRMGKKFYCNGVSRDEQGQIESVTLVDCPEKLSHFRKLLGK